MTEDSADFELGVARPRALLAAFAVAPAYFCIWLLPHLVPSAGGWFLFFLYVLSIPVVLLVLLALFLWGCGAIANARFRGRPTRPIHRFQVGVPTVAFFGLLSVVALGRALPNPLPSGSHRLEFDSVAWQAEGAAAFNKADITPRQQMLGSLLEQLDPSLAQTDLEEMLGPPHPPDYPYGAADADIHYRTGPQRDALFGLDSEWLLIYLDDSGNFLRYEMYVD